MMMARIYLRECEHLLSDIMKILHEEEKVAGATVFRGIAGFGGGGAVHTASLVDLSLDLPLIVEFYDRRDKVAAVIEILRHRLRLSHIVYWPVAGYLPTT